MNYLIYIISLYSLATSYLNQKEEKCFSWGVNGHPLTQADYSSSTWDYQLESMKDLNIDIYRFDVLLDSTGGIKNEQLYSSFLLRLIKNDITPFPVLSISSIRSNSKKEIYEKSFNQGKRFSSDYGSEIKVLEVGNEYDNKLLLSGKHDGTKKEHYDSLKADYTMLRLKGFINGLKSVHPGLKISLSFSWVHFYYLQLLNDRKINYDIIGYHWYSNMGDITAVKRYGNVLKTVSDRFQKPIWISEFNFRNGSLEATASTQKRYLTNSVSGLMSSRYVSAFFIYELLDQSAFRARKPQEAYYGIIGKDSSGNYFKKSSYYDYRNIINQYINDYTKCSNY